MSLTPIEGFTRRLPQAGRIRLGKQVRNAKGKMRPAKIDTFRFTSPISELLDPLAEIYGGQVKPWNEPKSGDRFELISKSRAIRVVLPPEPYSEWYEQWTGDKGLTHRCDGQWCDKLIGGPDGAEPMRIPCECAERGALACTYNLRLSLLLPEVDTMGVWRLDTKSRHARSEIPGLIEIVQMAQGRGLYKAELRLEERTAPGRRFNVPVLDLRHSVESLIAGDARLGQLSATTASPPAAPALTVGSAEGEASAVSPSTDQDIVEAEVLDEHVDPMFGKAFLDALPASQRNRALRRARELAEVSGVPVPANFAGIPEQIVDRLVGEWQRGNRWD